MVIGEIIFDSNLCDHNPLTSQTDRRHAIARLRFALAKVKKVAYKSFNISETRQDRTKI